MFFAEQVEFRWFYYGQLFANSTLVKVAFTPERFQAGIVYSAKALFSLLPLLLYIGLNIFGKKAAAVEADSLRFPKFLLTVCGLTTLAITIVGGDIFYGFRPYVPLIPLAALLVMHAASLGIATGDNKKELMFAGYILVVSTILQFSIDVNQIASSDRNRSWGENAKQIGLALKEKYSERQPLVAVHAAGAISYYSELPILDVFGLNDGDLAEHREEQKRFGRKLAGHELFDGHYVLTQQPDILVFDIPGLPPLCDGEFKDECDILMHNYKPKMLKIPGYDVQIWLRKGSKKAKN